MGRAEATTGLLARVEPRRVGAALGRRARLARIALAALRIRLSQGRSDKGAAAATAQKGGERRRAKAADSGLITPEYQELNQQMHREREGYGVQAQYHLTPVKMLVRAVSDDVLDYGCGKRLLEKGLGVPIQNYDPGLPGLDDAPEPADVVVCLDVLEHIEPDLIDQVLADLGRVTRRAGYFTVSTIPARKELPDGRNAHLIVEPPEWWQQRMERHFKVRLRLDEWDHATFVVEPR